MNRVLGVFLIFAFNCADAALVTYQIDGIVDTSEVGAISGGDSFTVMYQFDDTAFGPD